MTDKLGLSLLFLFMIGLFIIIRSPQWEELKKVIMNG